VSSEFIQVTGLTKRFGDVTAVDSVGLSIPEGKLVTLLGPSGCGKTTILRMVAGLERATEGRIIIDEEDVTRLPANLRDVTMVFQSYALFPHMDVYENVSYGLKVSGVSEPDIQQRTMETLELVGLEGLERRATNALSGGQQQRVALARALVMEPKVLLFDEPLSNLDAKLRRRVRTEIRELQQRLGITTLYVTHDQEEALAISDQIVVMRAGSIQQRGTPYDLYSSPTSRFVADFVGSANFLPGRYDGQHLHVADYSIPFEQDIATGDVTVMVRPEAVRIVEQHGLACRVRSTAYLGSVTDFEFVTEAGNVLATVHGEGMVELEPGDSAQVTFESAGVHLLRPNSDEEKS